MAQKQRDIKRSCCANLQIRSLKISIQNSVSISRRISNTRDKDLDKASAMLNEEHIHSDQSVRENKTPFRI